MSVIEMAKAHLQNVSQRINELTNQQTLLNEEIEKLKAYVTKGLQDIKDHDSKDS
jgi:uncharacterized small protein (DUF1192 family)